MTTPKGKAGTTLQEREKTKPKAKAKSRIKAKAKPKAKIFPSEGGTKKRKETSCTFVLYISQMFFRIFIFMYRIRAYHRENSQRYISKPWNVIFKA